MPKSTLAGVIPAVPTPITSDLTPDTDRLISFSAYLLDQGANGLNISGTTGEATSFSCEQRMTIIDALSRSQLDTSKMMVGTGAAAVSDAVQLSVAAGDAGFSGALVLPPFYFKDPTQGGLLRYFEKIVSATQTHNLDLYLYNFPALSGIAFTREFVAELRKAFGSRIAGLKDSSGNLEYASDIAVTFPDLKVFPSNEGTLMEARSGNYAGTISATANLSISACANVWRTGDEASLETAKKLRAIVANGPLVPRIKAIISDQKNDPAWMAVMPPYEVLSDKGLRNLIQELED